MTKKFAWSYSKLKNFRTCPKRHYEVDIAKTYKEDESEQLLWGNQVHDAMAKRVGKGIPLPKQMEHYEDWPARMVALKERGFETKVENKLAITSQMGPASYFDAAAWFRSVVDVLTLIPDDRAAITIDWKTGGKINPDFEQLALSAQTVFAHYPDIDEVAGIYVWLGHDAETLKVYRRDGMVPIWNDVMPWVMAMSEAHRTLTYPPNPSGICKRYCPVISCPHYGKGSY